MYHMTGQAHLVACLHQPCNRAAHMSAKMRSKSQGARLSLIRNGIAVSATDCICACGRYEGQINTTDFFTRLLCGIAYTGIAPQSFYTSPNGTRPHFDGTPVDVVSGVIAATVAHERSGFATYHVVNPHYKDGVSLDTIAAWLACAGIKVDSPFLAGHSHFYVQCRWDALDLWYRCIL